MEAKRKYNYHQRQYVDGSNVRKLNTLPEYGREPERIKQPERRKQHNRQLQIQPAINLVSFLVLAVALSITIYMAIDYVNAQIAVYDLNKTISSTEKELTKLTADNDAKLSEIDTTLDLKKVFETAVNDLGMVFPDHNKIVTYETAVSEYVRQYDKIPEANSEDLFEKLFKDN